MVAFAHFRTSKKCAVFCEMYFSLMCDSAVKHFIPARLELVFYLLWRVATQKLKHGIRCAGKSHYVSIKKIDLLFSFMPVCWNSATVISKGFSQTFVSAESCPNEQLSLPEPCRTVTTDLKHHI